MIILTLIALVIPGIWTISCHRTPAFRTLRERAHQTPSTPVLIIPGILGTRLKDPRDDRVVWGKAFDLSALSFHTSLLGKGPDGLELPIDSDRLSENRDHLVVDGIVDRFSIIPHVLTVRVYDTLLHALNACGYRPGSIRQCTAISNAYVFYYDWRRDNMEQVSLLHQRILALKEANGNPNLKVDIVAHSMGCLIAYYYALYGDVDVLDQPHAPAPTYAGAANIRRIVFMAPPFHGSTRALYYLEHGYRVGLRKILKEALFTMPSLYQLMPDSNPLMREDGTPLDRDLYDPETWTDLGLGFFSPEHQKRFIRECRLFYPKNWREASARFQGKAQRFLAVALHRAVVFHEAITQAAPSLPTLLIVSNRYATMDGVIVSRVNGAYRFIFKRKRTKKPGDKTVIQSSSMVDGSENWDIVRVASEHDRIPSNETAMLETIRFLSRRNGE